MMSSALVLILQFSVLLMLVRKLIFSSPCQYSDVQGSLQRSRELVSAFTKSRMSSSVTSPSLRFLRRPGMLLVFRRHLKSGLTTSICRVTWTTTRFESIHYTAPFIIFYNPFIYNTLYVFRITTTVSSTSRTARTVLLSPTLSCMTIGRLRSLVTQTATEMRMSLSPSHTLTTGGRT